MTTTERLAIESQENGAQVFELVQDWLNNAARFHAMRYPVTAEGAERSAAIAQNVAAIHYRHARLMLGIEA